MSTKPLWIWQANTQNWLWFQFLAAKIIQNLLNQMTTFCLLLSQAHIRLAMTLSPREALAASLSPTEILAQCPVCEIPLTSSSATGSKTVRVVVLISGSWGGVGWGGDNTNRVYGYATWSSLALSWSSLALHATLLDFHLHFHWWGGVGWGGDNTNHVYGYPTWSSLALHATLLDFR